MLIKEIGEYASLKEAQNIIATCKRADKRRGRSGRYYIRFRVVVFSE